MNERKTELLIENRLRNCGYFDLHDEIVVERQLSDSSLVKRLLKNASKTGSGVGKPEFIIRSREISDFLIVVECKADPTKHESSTRTKYRDFAVDGVLHYAAFLSRKFDVLAIAASGEDENSLRISHFLHLRGADRAHTWEACQGIVTFHDYYEAFIASDLKFRQDYRDLLKYSRGLNNSLKANKITEAQRGFLISGILIALKNKAFRKSYNSHKTTNQLTSALLETIRAEFDYADIPSERLGLLVQSFAFVTTLPVDKEYIEELIEGIDENINSFIKTHEYYDTIGQFYVEFLRYANNDKGLGIVLTPHYIGELFAILAGINRDSVVFDNCCGTAGLLIAAMKEMVKDAGADSQKIKKIRSQQLFGIEFQPSIYALAVCNMILHDDGKANIVHGDCFAVSDNRLVVKDADGRDIEIKPTVGLLNPPYRNKRIKSDKEELEYVLNNLEYLDPNGGGRCVAILPITCATNPTGAIGELKRRLLEKHTLEAVMSMPVELFHNSKTTVVTCIIVLTAHRPHPAGKKTWFGYWRDDGLIKIRHLGRIDADGSWAATRDYWTKTFLNREIIEGFSLMREVGPHDEWCAEAYMNTDYSKLDSESLSIMAQKFFISHVMSEAKLS